MMHFVAIVLAAAPVPIGQTAPPSVPATRAEAKKLWDAHKQAKPRLPMPPEPKGDDPISRVNNGRFRAYYLPKELRDSGFTREPDPAMSLDPTWKTRLFWVVSRINNCNYCVIHQEYKLAAGGLTDDEIAVLDTDWTTLDDADRAALTFTRKLTFEPHRVGADDVAALQKHYKPLQAAEIALAVAGFNSTNRWTGGLNIPAEEKGDNFQKGAKGKVRPLLTPPSEKYADYVSRIAPLPQGAKTASLPAVPERGPLESRADVEAKWRAIADRKPVLPLADAQDDSGKALPAWERLLKIFPKAGEARLAGLKAAQTKGAVSPKLRAAIAWTAARQDRAWYALALARAELRSLGLGDDDVFALDVPNPAGFGEGDRAALALTRKLAVSPALVVDADVEAVRKHFDDPTTAEIVYRICNAAFLDRLTEAAQLPPELARP